MQNGICDSIDFFIKITKLKEIKTIMQMNDIERSKILCRINGYFGNINNIVICALLCKFFLSYLYLGMKLIFFKGILFFASNVFACIANFGSSFVVPVTTAIFTFSTILSMTVSIHIMDDESKEKPEITSSKESKKADDKKNEKVWTLK